MQAIAQFEHKIQEEQRRLSRAGSPSPEALLPAERSSRLPSQDGRGPSAAGGGPHSLQQQPQCGSRGGSTGASGSGVQGPGARPREWEADGELFQAGVRQSSQHDQPAASRESTESPGAASGPVLQEQLSPQQQKDWEPSWVGQFREAVSLALDTPLSSARPAAGDAADTSPQPASDSRKGGPVAVGIEAFSAMSSGEPREGSPGAGTPGSAGRLRRKRLRAGSAGAKASAHKLTPDAQMPGAQQRSCLTIACHGMGSKPPLICPYTRPSVCALRIMH